MANLAGIDTPHANFQKSKIFKKFPKRGTKNVKNPKSYFFRKIDARLIWVPPWSFWLESIPNMHFCKNLGDNYQKKPLQPKLKELQKKFFYKKCVKSIFRKSQEISGL